MKKIYLLLLVAIVLLSAYSKDVIPKQVTSKKDYNSYLTIEENSALDILEKEYNFWSTKLEQTPNQYPFNAKVAATSTAIFKTTGAIEKLKEAEAQLLIANKKTNFNNAGYLRGLARNYVSQHRFKEALEVLTKAEYNGEKLTQTHLMLVDVYLELGNLDKVEKYLSKVKNQNNFDYLIRLSKYNDHIGNLDKAITFLENALAKVEDSNKKSLIKWSYTNLGDYYGHAGRIIDSYNSYLKALALNPNNSYAKKGIAWIVFSYERNPKEALRILDKVSQENMSPDYYLLKAEIFEFLENESSKKKEINKYLEATKNTAYGAMYAKYDVLLYAESEALRKKSIAIAKQEVKDRPTAQSYDLLAWAYYKNNQFKKAIDITREYVLDKTFEPEALLHAALILKKDDRADITNLKKELLDAVYELGPLAEKTIVNL